MMDFEKLFKQLKSELINLTHTYFEEYKDESVKDIEIFLENSKEKLSRWTRLLAANEITLDEYQWLLESQKDLFIMNSLYQAGISKIRLNKFKNKTIHTILAIVTKVIL